ncbi:sugar fermentation stimulation protein SfsA [Sulfitobacter alexandrii]|uniref:Sugar fermentation stimulation protein homolog n=1 Tax=Sulfitobacter alexandrii TaxID=1917485 RepID=A0A1J0WCW9_9RHOB|nr:DNA/RNA nuclease SfsA [Sulfitobacter alexandrii]APE42162.1 sugar fermentation stimulation protein SfsA [Sulfitobacter alexandrii]
MRFQTQLVPARLIRRYKRFLADCRLSDGREVTAHCANPGSMMGLAEPGTLVWLEPNDDPRKKLKFGWRLVDHENGHLTGVDTALPNRLIGSALEAGEIAALRGYDTVRAEVRYAEKSRVDFLLSGSDRPDCYVEVKSVTLCRAPGLAEFPDSVTARGARHLRDLMRMAQAGHRAVLLYLVQRTDCTSVAMARDIDPAYAEAHAAATDAGVETRCLGTHITPECVTLAAPLALQGTPR